MTTPREHLEDWLRDAYAMERHAETMLKSQAARLDNYPVLRDRIRQHVETTLEQQRLLEGCLQRLEIAPSAIKDLAARIAAHGQAAGGVFVSDEVVKGAMAGYVFENLEIASYKTLIAAAQLAGEKEIRDCGERILKQEIDMAQWLSEHLPDIVVAFLERSASERGDAKR
ncbi:ferritin-like domain-containing protein [Burkholderia oklahomensis]|uniref:ferritin-like domain-containing protein n=1 Tax=Burkholderia oklahomensis TaxID=342113 RepID=UPI002653BC71|nr:ferritin-like domain-containing protein [Burkholderia oklahomensis]MDN7673069.1 ferritin-like domain-containing protein [Burkholderia oklahomensis]